MRFTSSAVLFCLFALLTSACDLTQGMNAKMDQTNANMNNTNAKIDQTNGQLTSTNDAIHKQTLLVALDGMISDDSTRVLVPVPFAMLPFGQTFAENAHEDELMDWFYAEYKNLVEGTADDGQRVSIDVFTPSMDNTGHEVLTAQYSSETIGGKAYQVPQTSWEFPTTYLDTFNYKKDIILNEMQVVASFIPQAMLQSIVADQIGNGGLREQTAYLILNLRDIFERGALLGNSLYNDKLNNLSQVTEALRLVTDIDYIAHLPCTAEIAKTKIRGYLDLSTNYIYEQQAVQSALSQVVAVLNNTTPFVPVSIAFDPNQPINNTYQAYYSLGSDNMTVTPIDQSAARTAEIAYDPLAYKQDWKDLKRHFQSDLPKADQTSADGQAALAQIQSHL